MKARRSQRGRASQRMRGDWQVLSGEWPQVNAIAQNTKFDVLLYSFVPAGANTGAPTPQEIEISEIDLSLNVYTSGTPGVLLVASGLYISQFSTDTSNMATQNPVNTDDVNRDNWLDLWADSGYFPAVQGFPGLKHKVNLRKPFTLSPGFGLTFTVANDNLSAGIANFAAWVRVKLRHVW